MISSIHGILSTFNGTLSFLVNIEKIFTSYSYYPKAYCNFFLDYVELNNKRILYNDPHSRIKPFLKNYVIDTSEYIIQISYVLLFEAKLYLHI
jgi:hypothetical protein